MGVLRSLEVGKCLKWGVMNSKGERGRGSVLRQQSVTIVGDGGGIFLNFLSLQEL